MILGIQNEEPHLVIHVVIQLAEVGRLLKLFGKGNDGVIIENSVII